MRPRSRRRVGLSILVALLVVTAACSGGKDDKKKEAAATTTTEAPTTTAPPTFAPLTGLPGPVDPRPALVVKIDNVEPKARPQAGLNQADIVFEERVEGSVTRLLAIFHSADAAPAGPVRSARTSDLGIISALHKPFFAWSGANSIFAARVRAANLTDVGYDRASSQYQRANNRHAPDNLMLKSTADIRALPSNGASVPPQFFAYRADGAVPVNLEPITGVRITFGTSAGSAPVEYHWNGQGWARTQKGTPHLDAAGVQVAPANVIIQFVPYASSGVNDQFGTPIPEAQLVGEGDAWVFTAGGLIRGHWKKTALDAVTTYTDATGNPIGLTPGRTWVALPQPGGAQTL